MKILKSTQYQDQAGMFKCGHQTNIGPNLCWAVTWFDWLEPLVPVPVPVSKNKTGNPSFFFFFSFFLAEKKSSGKMVLTSWFEDQITQNWNWNQVWFP